MGCGSSRQLKESEAKATELQTKVTELEAKVALTEKELAAALGQASEAEAKATQAEEKAKEAQDSNEAVMQQKTKRRSLQLESIYKVWQKEACEHAFDECEALFEDVDDAQVPEQGGVLRAVASLAQLQDVLVLLY